MENSKSQTVSLYLEAYQKKKIRKLFKKFKKGQTEIKN